jgi:hypothetical protein
MSIKNHAQLVAEGLVVRDTLTEADGTARYSDWRPAIGGQFSGDPQTGELSLIEAPTAAAPFSSVTKAEREAAADAEAAAAGAADTESAPASGRRSRRAPADDLTPAAGN